MRPEITATPKWRAARNRGLRPPCSYTGSVSPASSAVIGVTVVADLQDALAALRTAGLLARSLKATLSIDVFGMKSVIVGPAESENRATVMETLDLIHTHLSEIMSSGTGSLILEANITAASFLTIGGISVRVHAGDAVEWRTGS